MKKLVLLLVCLLPLCLCACGKAQEKAAPELEALYQEMLKVEAMPDMIPVPPEKAEYIFGLMQADCEKSVTAVCQNSLQADEIWLVDAVNAEAAAKIEALAKTRLDQKAAKAQDYSPEQYKIIREGKVLRSGNRVCLLVSPQVAKLAALLG